MPRRIILVRHGESVGNVLTMEERASFIVPTHEYGLTERGRRQAEATAAWMRRYFTPPAAVVDHAFSDIFVSYYRRSRETAEIMFPKDTLVEDARLAEAHRGIYHVLPRDFIKEKFPEEIERKDREGLYHYRAPGGENWPDVELRVHSFLDMLHREYDDHEDLVIVGHAHWISLFRRVVERLTIEETLALYHEGLTPNCGVTWYTVERRGRRSRLELQEKDIVPWQGVVI